MFYALYIPIYFSHFKHLATKLCNFIKFVMFFDAMIMNFTISYCVLDSFAQLVCIIVVNFLDTVPSQFSITNTALAKILGFCNLSTVNNANVVDVEFSDINGKFTCAMFR